MLACLAPAARAEVGLGAAVNSDYRYRGVSFSDGRPSFSLTATYDHPKGPYAGLTAIAGATEGGGVRSLGYQAYLGVAGRIGPQSSWDVGAARVDLNDHLWAPRQIRYTEVYAGGTWRNLTGHLHYTPGYEGKRPATLYLDLAWARRLSDDWRLFAHAGALSPLNDETWARVRKPRYDASVGVAYRIRQAELQLSFVSARGPAGYPGVRAGGRDTVLLGASYAF